VLHYDHVPPPREPVSLRTLLAGAEFVWQRKALLGAVSLDLFAVLLGGATALLPMFAKDILHVGPWGLGLLRAAPAAGALLGRLEAPSVHMSAVVLEGSDDGTLSRGAGHIEDTPFPGQSGNIGIAGHRDTVFRPLRNIKVGDPLALTTANRTYRYRVSKTLIVGPDDVYVLDPTKDPTLTLVTCYPFDFIGHAPKRFIIQATLAQP